LVDTPGPAITTSPQHPSEIVAGRDTNLELRSNRRRRGDRFAGTERKDRLAATEVAAAAHTITMIAPVNSAAFRTTP
jgi:hypothetical protein